MRRKQRQAHPWGFSCTAHSVCGLPSATILAHCKLTQAQSRCSCACWQGRWLPAVPGLQTLHPKLGPDQDLTGGCGYAGKGVSYLLQRMRSI